MSMLSSFALMGNYYFWFLGNIFFWVQGLNSRWVLVVGSGTTSYI